MIITLCILWYISGVASFYYWWTNDCNLTLGAATFPNKAELIEKMARAMYELNFKDKEPTKYDVPWEQLKINHPAIAKILIDYSGAALDAFIGMLPEVPDVTFLVDGHTHTNIDVYKLEEVYNDLLALKRE